MAITLTHRKNIPICNNAGRAMSSSPTNTPLDTQVLLGFPTRASIPQDQGYQGNRKCLQQHLLHPCPPPSLPIFNDDPCLLLSHLIHFIRS